MAFRYVKTPDELHEQLAEQIGHLRRSIAHYDDGISAEAQRIAGALYVLFADSGQRAKSLTGLVGIKNKLVFRDSSKWPDCLPKQIRLGPPLCVAGDKGAYLPRGWEGAKAFPEIGFSNWWDMPVFRNYDVIYLTRRNMIAKMRHQDGGGHVDETLDNSAYHFLKYIGDVHLGKISGVDFLVYFPEEYESFTFAGRFSETKRAVIATTTDPSKLQGVPIANAHWASMRQIAAEADDALRALGY